MGLISMPELADEIIRNSRADLVLLGRELLHIHMEQMANLDKIPIPYGFKVAAFPIKIRKASGAWVRAVAIIDE